MWLSSHSKRILFSRLFCPVCTGGIIKQAKPDLTCTAFTTNTPQQQRTSYYMASVTNPQLGRAPLLCPLNPTSVKRPYTWKTQHTDTPPPSSSSLLLKQRPYLASPATRGSRRRYKRTQQRNTKTKNDISHAPLVRGQPSGTTPVGTKNLCQSGGGRMVKSRKIRTSTTYGKTGYQPS